MIKNLQPLTDKTAIGLSFLCTLHCLAMPLLVVLLPSLAALPLEGEAFHLWMVFIVVPVSVFALTMGCKNHKRYRVFWVGGFGLAILLATVLLGHDTLGETWEKTLTVIGSSVIALGHFWNHRLCQKKDSCDCSD